MEELEPQKQNIIKLLKSLNISESELSEIENELSNLFDSVKKYQERGVNDGEK